MIKIVNEGFENMWGNVSPGVLKASLTQQRSRFTTGFDNTINRFYSIVTGVKSAIIYDGKNNAENDRPSIYNS